MAETKPLRQTGETMKIKNPNTHKTTKGFGWQSRIKLLVAVFFLGMASLLGNFKYAAKMTMEQMPKAKTMFAQQENMLNSKKPKLNQLTTTLKTSGISDKSENADFSKQVEISQNWAFKIFKTLLHNNYRSLYQSAEQTKLREWIIEQFKNWGYATKNAVFETMEKNHCIAEKLKNLVFVLPGKSDQVITIGTTYTMSNSIYRKLKNSFYDTRSSIALAMALARMAKRQKFPSDYTLKFIFWDHGHQGASGSNAYVRTEKTEVVKKWQLYIDLNGIAGGDELYIGFRQNKKAYYYQFKALIKELSLPIKPAFAYTTNADQFGESAVAKSDYDALEELIETVNFESSNYKMDKKDGYSQVNHDAFKNSNGKILATINDDFTKLEKYFPGRIQKQLQQLSLLIQTFFFQRGKINVQAIEKIQLEDRLKRNEITNNWFLHRIKQLETKIKNVFLRGEKRIKVWKKLQKVKQAFKKWKSKQNEQTLKSAFSF